LFIAWSATSWRCAVNGTSGHLLVRGWGPGDPKERAVVGGWVADSSAVAARLTDATGDRVLKDNVENGVAIFMWKGELDLRHAHMELLDTDHQVLRAGPMRRMAPS